MLGASSGRYLGSGSGLYVESCIVVPALLPDGLAGKGRIDPSTCSRVLMDVRGCGVSTIPLLIAVLRSDASGCVARCAQTGSETIATGLLTSARFRWGFLQKLADTLLRSDRDFENRSAGQSLRLFEIFCLRVHLACAESNLLARAALVS